MYIQRSYAIFCYLDVFIEIARVWKVNKAVNSRYSGSSGGGNSLQLAHSEIKTHLCPDVCIRKLHKNNTECTNKPNLKLWLQVHYFNPSQFNIKVFHILPYLLFDLYKKKNLHLKFIPEFWAWEPNISAIQIQCSHLSLSPYRFMSSHGKTLWYSLLFTM